MRREATSILRHEDTKRDESIPRATGPMLISMVFFFSARTPRPSGDYSPMNLLPVCLNLINKFQRLWKEQGNAMREGNNNAFPSAWVGHEKWANRNEEKQEQVESRLRLTLSLGFPHPTQEDWSELKDG